MEVRNMRQFGQIVCGTAGIALLSSPAFAQEAEQPADALQEVRVTGSRIVQAPGMFTPTPVTAVAADEIKTLSPANLIESLNTLPVFSGNSTQQVALGGQNSGGSNVNLHGVTSMIAARSAIAGTNASERTSLECIITCRTDKSVVRIGVFSAQ